MRELESKYSRHLAVIGVQSGKYHAERVTSRIRDASLRLDAIHAVLNDRQFRTWRSYAVSAWPTLVAIDPSGYVVGAHAGEFAAEMLFPFIDGLIESARSRGVLNEESLHFEADKPTSEPGTLRYPGKVLVDGDRLIISDSGHHRILVAGLRAPSVARIEMTCGTGEPGFSNGAKGQLSFPQGTAVDGNTLYVADTGNHTIRSVSLSSGELRTVAGTGAQMRTRGDRQQGAMSSPWDLALTGETLFVAMAGTHQLWSVNLATRTSRVHSGTGGEDIRDGEHRDALLAQPMGIVAVGNRVYFADSESSAIRWADTAENGAVGTVVGTGLFDFGDVDGTGDDVRLQHPQGVAINPDGGLLVADSYNDCIKAIDPVTRSARVWVRGLSEPSGISCSRTHAYVADTNAHRIAVIDLKTQEVSDLTLE
ncbi:MAG TPA: alkyl hydroperoxide reductase [Gemmatimonadaceae bacterium]